MGVVKSKQLANGNFQVEITYGGTEAAFGGVDTSAPPAYIDPRCFVATDGAMVVNNKLCAVALEQQALPTMWSGITGVTLLGFGTFYNSLFGQYNYALGFKSVAFGSVGVTPTGITYTFYITSWAAGTATPNNDTLVISLYDSFIPAIAASLTLPCIASSSQQPSAGSGATGTATVGSNGFPTAATLTGGTGYGVGDAVEFLPTGYPIPADPGWIIVDSVGAGGSISTSHLATNSGSGYPTGSIAVYAGSVEVASHTVLKINGTSYSASAYTGSATAAGIVSTLVSLINASDPNVSASASLDGISIILTAKTAGTAGNAITVQDASTAAITTNPPPFYFPCTIAATLEGGVDAVSAPAPVSIGPVSSIAEGGTVYFANLGPMILQYAGPGKFSICTMYQGVNVIRKFAGSLIGIGVTPALGFEVQNQDMILAWSAAEKPTIWNPVDGSGNVTGAGFEQLADIGEYLSGLIVSNGTGWILRKQGVSYATPTGNATAPFAVYHIGLGEQGEGTQVPSLVTQYDSVGCYVGNSDVWQITGSISSIGDKIKSAIFTALQQVGLSASQICAGSASVNIGGNEFPVAMFVIGSTLYLFNTSNGTWTTLSLTSLFAPTVLKSFCGAVATKNVMQETGQYGQADLGVMFQFTGTTQPSLYALTETIANNVAITNTFNVVFPQEEISFGRDVTIDALYVALQALLGVNCTLNVYLNGQLYATQTLANSQFNGIDGNPTELQLFPASTGISTGHSPQLTLQLVNSSVATVAQARFTKITMFGSIAPNQRPV